MRIGCLCCPCTTQGVTLHARLLRDASLSPEGGMSFQLKSTTRCSVGGCGFRATYLKTVGLGAWAARFCRRSGRRIRITTKQAGYPRDLFSANGPPRTRYISRIDGRTKSDGLTTHQPPLNTLLVYRIYEEHATSIRRFSTTIYFPRQDNSEIKCLFCCPSTTITRRRDHEL
jgi:hypothetical protein